MTDTAASIDVTSFRAAHDGDDSWRVHVECREDMSAQMKKAGIKGVGYEHDTVLILLGIDGEALDVIATDDPNWPTNIGRARNNLYEQLIDARRALNIAISAMEIKS